jgi:hypothetical protein
MQIILQSGFLTFVRRYTNAEIYAQTIFNAIHDYFFKTTEIYRSDYEEHIRSELKKQSHIKEGIFLSTKDKDRLAIGSLQPTERTLLTQEIIKKEKIIVSVKLFRQMLTEMDIPLHLSYPSNSLNKTIRSSDVFLIESTFYELLSTNFEVINGAYVKYNEADLLDCMNIFFKEFNKEDSDYMIYRKDEDVNAFFKLYIEKEINNICVSFQNDHDWKIRPEEDCTVSQYLQKMFYMPPTKVNKFIMPSAANVRKNLILNNLI